MDDADIAIRNDTFFNRLAIENARARIAACAPARPSATHCIECGDTIPKDRRDAMPGCTLCVECQSAIERR